MLSTGFNPWLSTMFYTSTPKVRIYVYFNCIIASYRPHNNRKFIFSEKRKLFYCEKCK